jgi:PAS domain S-box-containing protein
MATARKKKKEKKLDIFRIFMNNTEAQLAYLDPNFNFVEVNSSYVKGCGHSRKELIGKNHFDLFPNKENQKIFTTVRNSGKPLTFKDKPFVYVNQPEKGVTYWDWSLVPIKRDNSKVEGLVLSLVDVTNHHRLLEKLEAARERATFEELRWKTMMETIPIGVKIVEQISQKIIYANQNIKAIFGYNPIGLSLEQHLRKLKPLASDGRPFSLKNLPVVKALETGKTIKREEIIFTKPNKKLIILTSSAAPIYDNGGRAIAAINIFEDISHQRKVENQIMLANRRLEYLLKTASAVIYTARIDKQIGFTFISDNLVKVAGFTAKQFLSKPSFWLKHVHPQDQDRALAEIKKLEKKGNHIFEYRFLCKDKKYHWMRDEMELISNGNHRSKEVIGFVINIDEQKRLEKQKNEFLSVISHELKTPLASLKAFAQILQKKSKGPYDPKTSYFIKRMDFQINRLADLINELLDITKIRAGKFQLKKTKFNLNKLIEETINDIKLVAAKDYKIVFRPKAKSYVRGNRRRLEQVLLNLIVNAIQYSPKSKIIIIKLTKTNGKVIVSVKDFGIGIPKSEQKHIFKRFYQVNSSAIKRESFSSLGLGLYLSSKIIKDHGGKIWFKSRLNQGSTFFFSLPNK